MFNINILIHSKHHLMSLSQTFSGSFSYEEGTTVMFLETRVWARHTDQNDIHMESGFL